MAIAGNRRVEMNFDYLDKKRSDVLRQITPICEAFKIEDYDYIVDTSKGDERLRIYDTEIGCSCNSISAVVDELVGYIFIKTFCRNRSLGAFEKQTTNRIKEYWISVT